MLDALYIFLRLFSVNMVIIAFKGVDQYHGSESEIGFTLHANRSVFEMR